MLLLQRGSLVVAGASLDTGGEQQIGLHYRHPATSGSEVTRPRVGKPASSLCSRDLFRNRRVIRRVYLVASRSDPPLFSPTSLYEDLHFSMQFPTRRISLVLLGRHSSTDLRLNLDLPRNSKTLVRTRDIFVMVACARCLRQKTAQREIRFLSITAHYRRRSE